MDIEARSVQWVFTCVWDVLSPAARITMYLYEWIEYTAHEGNHCAQDEARKSYA